MTIEIPVFVCGIAVGTFGTLLLGGVIWCIRFAWRKHQENERIVDRLRTMGIR